MLVNQTTILRLHRITPSVKQCWQGQGWTANEHGKGRSKPLTREIIAVLQHLKSSAVETIMHNFKYQEPQTAVRRRRDYSRTQHTRRGPVSAIYMELLLEEKQYRLLSYTGMLHIKFLK